MNKIKFVRNKVYKYVTNTHPVHIFFDMLASGLGIMAVTGITFMFYQIIFNGVTADISCAICY